LVPNEEEVTALLRSGTSVIWPDPAKVGRLEDACRQGAATLPGTGIHPSGITERFPLMVWAVRPRVPHVRAEEFSDIRTYGAPDVIRHVMGFGGTPEEALASPMAALLGRASGRRCGWWWPRWASPPTRAPRRSRRWRWRPRRSTPIGVIEPGKVAARCFHWRVLVDGLPVVTAAVSWLMGEEHLEPQWSLGPEGERFEVEVTGDPSVKLTFNGLQPETVEAGLVRNPGIVSTANHCVNAIPYVVAAEPGIRTYLELPLIAGRAAPHLGLGRASPT
jgi:hypothetical protein